jgi:hypothetical protein
MSAKSFAWFSAKTLTVVIEDCQGDEMEIVIDASGIWWLSNDDFEYFASWLQKIWVFSASVD